MVADDNAFDWGRLSEEDRLIADMILGGLREPDLIIAPEKVPYLYRWHVIPRNKLANVYFHVQIASDPERPLHDHPWDNTSHILSGGYDEVIADLDFEYDGREWTQELANERTVKRRKGDTIHRAYSAPHRLVLPLEFDYTMTLFTTGAHVHEWGFYYPDGFRPKSSIVTVRQDGATKISES